MENDEKADPIMILLLNVIFNLIELFKTDSTTVYPLNISIHFFLKVLGIVWSFKWNYWVNKNKKLCDTFCGSQKYDEKADPIMIL